MLALARRHRRVRLKVAVSERGYGEAYPQQVGNDRGNEHAGRRREARLLRLVLRTQPRSFRPSYPGTMQKQTTNEHQ